MITVANGTNTYNGLSTDTKPLFARNGDLFAEIDTGTNYMFDAESGDWTEVDLGGGGVTPTGEIEIVQNGTFDVTNYASADVNVPTTGLDPYYKTVIERNPAQSLLLPSNVTKIGVDAFYGYENLQSIELHSNITRIERSGFTACTNLRTVIFHEGIDYIGEYAFSSCRYLDIEELPSTVTYIGQNAFNSCISLKSLKSLPSGITTLGGSAFMQCSSLTEMTLPNGVTRIEANVFRGCSNLLRIVMQNAVTRIDGSAFYSCSKLAEIICHAVTPPTLDPYALDGVPANCAIYVPAESVDAYKAATNWSARADYIQAIQS